LKKLSSFITDENFEFFQSVNEIQGNNDIAELDLFFELIKDDSRARRWKLTHGTESERSLLIYIPLSGDKQRISLRGRLAAASEPQRNSLHLTYAN
jgi:hypothetical protein